MGGVVAPQPPPGWLRTTEPCPGPIELGKHPGLPPAPLLAPRFEEVTLSPLRHPWGHSTSPFPT